MRGNLAKLYLATKRYDEAESIFKLCAERLEHSLGAEHPYVAVSQTKLTEVYLAEGKAEEAEPFCVKAMAIRQNAWKEPHPQIAESTRQLAQIRAAQGNYDEAEMLFEKAIKMYGAVFGANPHPDTAKALEFYAAFLQDTERSEKAEPLRARANSIREAMRVGAVNSR